MDDINPQMWGKSAWKFFHSISYSYPLNPTPEEQQDFKNFFLLIQKVLPCSMCRTNYVSHISKFPLSDTVLSSKQNLIQWLINIRNETNILLHKQILTELDIMEELLEDVHTYYDT